MAYFKNFSEESNSMSSLSVQVLTIFRVTEVILQDQTMTKIISDTLLKMITGISVVKIMDQELFLNCLQFREDLMYIFHPDIMPQVVAY